MRVLTQCSTEVRDLGVTNHSCEQIGVVSFAALRAGWFGCNSILFTNNLCTLASKSYKSLVGKST